MNSLDALTSGKTPVAVSLEGYQLGYVRTTAAWDTGPRTLNEQLFYLINSGELILSIGKERKSLAAGWAALIPPKTTFKAMAGTPAPHFWRLRITLPIHWPAVLIQAGASDLEPVVSRLVAEATHAAHPLRDAAIRGGLIVLLAGLQRQQHTDASLGLTLAQRQILEEYVDANPEATPRDLMRQIDLTLDYGTRLFTRTMGRPPRQWLLERRLHRAATRVAEGDEPIARIADDFGYTDVRLFARQFRTVFGQPPARFRAQVRHVTHDV